MSNINQLVLESVKTDTISELQKIMLPIKYDNFTNEEKYKIKSSQELLKSKKGICYDEVEFERMYLEKYNYPVKTYFAYDNKPFEENPTHTFLIFEENNKYYWFENSWQNYRGVHGPFKSYKDAIKYVSSHLKTSTNWNVVNIIEYKKFNTKGMNINQFGKYLYSKRKK